MKQTSLDLPLTHDSLMPYGRQYKGLKMDEVPAKYLFQLAKRHGRRSENKKLNKVLAYFQDYSDYLDNRLQEEEDYGWKPPEGLESRFFAKTRLVPKSNIEGDLGYGYVEEEYYPINERKIRL